LARLSSWGASHHEAFEHHGLPAVTARWGDGWLVGPADGETPEIHSRIRKSYRGWELEQLRPRAHAWGVPEDRIELLIRDLDRETRAIVMTAYDDTSETTAEPRRRSLIVAACFQLGIGDLDKAVQQVGIRRDVRCCGDLGTGRDA
jgi:hypothetical protein